MNVTAFNRIAHTVTSATTWTRRGRRLAVTVPMAAVVAVGLVGCESGKGAQKSATSVITSSPSASVSATSSPSAVASPSASPFTSTPSVSTLVTPSLSAPASPTTKPVVAVSPKAKAPALTAAMAKEVVATFVGLPQGSRVEVGGKEVSFQVKWTNNTKTRQPNVVPVVSAEAYEGNPCAVITPTVEGTIQRKDAGGWVKHGLTQGTGMDYAQRDEPGAFSLGPGESRTVQYKMHLAPTNGTGTLDLEAQAYDGLTFKSTFSPLGAAAPLKVAVVDGHRPTVTLIGKPTDPVAGRTKQFGVEIGNPTKDLIAKMVPTLTVADPREAWGGPRADQVNFEVQDGSGWRKLPSVEWCGWVQADTSSLVKALPAGAKQRHTFRVSTVGRWNDGLEYTVGATGDQHPSTPTKF